MHLKANYQKTFKYTRQNARRLTYDVGYRLIQRDDGTFVYGYEIVQEQYDGSIGGGAISLNYEGSYDDAEAYLRQLLKEQIETLPEYWESDQQRNRKETDEAAVTDAWLIRRIFGYWPKFHDAEVLSIELRRRTSANHSCTDLEFSLHHWGQDNPTGKGEHAHCKITFLLEDVEGKEFDIENVAHPSYIGDLRFSPCDDGRIQVDLNPSSGVSMLLYCAVARVQRIEPFRRA